MLQRVHRHLRTFGIAPQNTSCAPRLSRSSVQGVYNISEINTTESVSRRRYTPLHSKQLGTGGCETVALMQDSLHRYAYNACKVFGRVLVFLLGGTERYRVVA